MAKKRGHGDGTIFERADGRWTAAIRVGSERRWFYGKTRKEVAQKLKEALRAQESGVDLTAEIETVEAFLERWLTTVVEQKNKDRTQVSYRETVKNHIVPAIGRHRLDKLRPEHVQAMIAGIQKAGKTRTAQLARVILVRALGYAVKWRIVSFNAASLSEAPKVEKHEIVPLTVEQAQALLNATKGGQDGVAILTALVCGLRRGELLALRHEDLDLGQGVLRVTGSLQRIRGKLVRGTPKTKTSARILPLGETVVQALSAHILIQQQLFPTAEYVFTSSTGTPIDPRNLLRRFKQALAAAGLPDSIRFHDLRHSCATFMLAGGAHPRVVQEVLGHSQMSTTMEIYTHVLPATMTAEALKIDRLLGDGSASSAAKEEADEAAEEEE